MTNSRIRVAGLVMVLLLATTLSISAQSERQQVEVREYFDEGFTIKKHEDGFTVIDHVAGGGESAGSGYDWSDMEEAYRLEGLSYHRSTRIEMATRCSQDVSGVWAGNYSGIEFTIVLFPGAIANQRYQIELYGRPVRLGTWQCVGSIDGMGDTLTFSPAWLRHFDGYRHVEYRLFEPSLGINTLEIRTLENDPIVDAFTISMKRSQ